MEYYIQYLRGLREDSDKTQQDIAAVLGTSQTMYARYERGANELPLRHFITLCRYYRISADTVLGFDPATKRK
ncbi:MAG: helix-turn-helix domain-containing protein [Oscillospiraceae bacterium]|nr:helix-turn-helix domain-containing protein [Oscillospiraceae bacterium]